MAKHLGARVITTASAANHDYLRGIGADEIIDYNAVDFTKVVKDCDAVFDTVGGDVAQRSFAVLKPGGRAAFIASGAQAPKPERSDVVALRPRVGRDRPHLERIAALVAIGAVRPPEVTRYKLSDAVAAHKVSQSRHFRGKLRVSGRAEVDEDQNSGLQWRCTSPLEERSGSHRKMSIRVRGLARGVLAFAAAECRTPHPSRTSSRHLLPQGEKGGPRKFVFAPRSASRAGSAMMRVKGPTKIGPLTGWTA